MNATLQLLDYPALGFSSLGFYTIAAIHLVGCLAMCNSGHVCIVEGIFHGQNNMTSILLA